MQNEEGLVDKSEYVWIDVGAPDWGPCVPVIDLMSHTLCPCEPGILSKVLLIAVSIDLQDVLHTRVRFVNSVPLQTGNNMGHICLAGATGLPNC